MRLARLRRFNDGFVGCEPVPFGPGQVGLRRQLGLAGVVTADQLAALGRSFHHHFGAIHVHGEDVTALVGQTVGSFGLLDRHRPVAGEDYVAGDAGFDRARPHHKRVDVAQHLGDGLGRYKTQLAALAHVPSDHAIQVLAFINVPEVAACVFGVLPLSPHAAAMREAHVRVLGGNGKQVRIKVAKRGGEQQRSTVLGNHAGHGLLHGRGLGHVLFFHHFNAGHLFYFSRGLGLRLVVAVVVTRADIDHTNGQRLLRPRALAPGAQGAGRAQCRNGGSNGFEGFAAANAV